jgi:DNA repair protein RecO (recombination protein O)
VSLITARAVLLRAHPYSESSRVLRFLTDGHGVVGIMARGVRRSRSQSTAGLDTFAQGDLTFYMKETRELQTYKDFNVTHPRRGLGRDPRRLAGASVLAELVLRHTAEGDTTALFETVAGAMDRLAEVPADALVPRLLCEGWTLVDVLGFRPDFEHCISCGVRLEADDMSRMDLAQGGLRCPACLVGESGDGVGSGVGPRVGPGARAQLRALLLGEVPDRLDRPRAHLQLLSDFVTYHVAGSRPFDAFRVLAALLPDDRDA